MVNTEEIRKAMLAPDTDEVKALLEEISTDEGSRVLAKTYISALADRQRLERSKAELAAV